MKDFVSIMRTCTVLFDGGGGLSPPNPMVVLMVYVCRNQEDAAGQYREYTSDTILKVIVRGRIGQRLIHWKLLHLGNDRARSAIKPAGICRSPYASFDHTGGVPAGLPRGVPIHALKPV